MDAVLDLVVDHALGLDLPQRRALAGLVADLAGAVDGVVGDHDACRSMRSGAGGGQPPILADQGAEALSAPSRIWSVSTT